MEKETKSQKGTSWVRTSLLVLIALIGLFLCYQTCKSPGPIPNQEETDTVFQPLYIFPDAGKIPDGSKVYKPKQVIEFKERLRIDSFISFEFFRDTLFLTKGEDTLGTYDRRFLEYVPKNPKLVRMQLGYRNLEMELLYPDGQPRVKQYQTDMGSFAYMWMNDSLYIEPLTKFEAPSFPVKTSANLYLTMNPFLMTPRLAIDGAITFRRLSLVGYLGFQSKMPYYDFQIGTRVSLK